MVSTPLIKPSDDVSFSALCQTFKFWVQMLSKGLFTFEQS